MVNQLKLIITEVFFKVIDVVQGKKEMFSLVLKKPSEETFFSTFDFLNEKKFSFF
jgi:hypothetical protein